MTHRSGLAALWGAVTVGMLAAGRAWAEPSASLAAFDRRPLLGFVFENLGRMSKLRRQLDLTPEQRAKLRELIKSRKPEIIEAMSKVRAGRKKVHEAIRAEPANEAAIRRAVASITDALADAAVLRSRVRRAALDLLTPSQRERADKFIAESQESADDAFAEFAGK